MSALLFAFGVAGAVAGFAMIGFGISINEFSLGNSLIVAGTAAIAGGLIVIGLSAAVGHLQRISESLAGRAMPRSGRQPDGFEQQSAAGRAIAGGGRIPFPPKPNANWSGQPHPMDPRFHNAPSIDLAQDMAERPPSPYAPMPRYQNEAPYYGNEADEAPLAPVRQAPQYAPQARPAEYPDYARGGGKPQGLNGSGASHQARYDPALDTPWQNAAPTERAPQGGFFESMWPAESRAAKAAEPAARGPQRDPAAVTAAVDPRRAEPPRAEPQYRPEPQHRAEPVRAEPVTALRPSNEPRAVTILKSGVVDGMSYTLYVDGSIEADLPQGTLRFASINDLSTHLEKN